MSLSGGLLWHGRAWLSRALWQQTCEQISDWLHQVQPHSKELLLIGASAGWMMPNGWLQGFEKVTTWDIDPMAARLFRWRHAAALQASGTQLRCQTGDALASLANLLPAHPKACILFDNVLGQYRFHCRDVAHAAEEIARIVATVRGREWGSLHDTFSGPAQSLLPSGVIPPMHSSIRGPQSDAAADQTQLARLGAKGKWLDHLTASVFDTGTRVHHIAWPYQTHYWHCLQAGWVKN